MPEQRKEPRISKLSDQTIVKQQVMHGLSVKNAANLKNAPRKCSTSQNVSLFSSQEKVLIKQLQVLPLPNCNNEQERSLPSNDGPTTPKFSQYGNPSEVFDAEEA